MMKKIFSLALAAAVALTLCTPAFAAGSAGFQKVNSYQDGQFGDVDSGSWYADNVKTAYEYGLMNGVSGSAFGPGGDMTAAQAIAVACRIHSAYSGNEAQFEGGEPWYQPYVDYAKRHQIIGKDYPYSAPVTRIDFALFISNALPDEALPKINEVGDNAIPDVFTGSPMGEAASLLRSSGLLGSGVSQLPMLSAVMGLEVDAVPSTPEKQAVYRLYRAGLLTGSGSSGAFHPDSGITRAEAAAVISRAVEPSLRKNVTLTPAAGTLVPVGQLANLPSVKERATDAQLAQAYEAARPLMELLADRPREVQLCAIALALRVLTDTQVEYSMDSAHYADPYGFFVEKSASCAGCTRATGLCLNMLGIPYEHVNENGWTHQWTRVNVGGVYWICDAYGLYCGPEQVPYQHPNIAT